MKHKIVALVLVVGLCGQAEAVTYMGNLSCNAWAAEARNPQVGGWVMLSYKRWLVGLLSGLAAGMNKDILKDTNGESLYLWMDNYCQVDPLSNVYDGGMNLFNELVKRKGLL